MAQRAERAAGSTRRRAIRRPSMSIRSPRSIAPRRPASTTSAALAPSARSRISTICCSSAPRSAAIRSKAIARNARPTSMLGTRFAKKPMHLKIPITIAGMSFGSLSGRRQGGARPRRFGHGHLDHHRRRRHDRGGAASFEAARLSDPAVALRHEPGPSPQGRCDRDRRRPGRQAGRRRHAARPEDFEARG